MHYWLMKSEPSEFAIDDLKSCRVEPWDGVRNYQARNMMRDQMQTGDLAFFYHSNCPTPGIVGTMTIHRSAYPDPTAFDPGDPHYDPKSDPACPRWFCVDVRYRHKFRHIVSLATLRRERPLAKMRVLQRGNRLSITPVRPAEWEHILSLAGDRPGVGEGAGRRGQSNHRAGRS